jgi:basic membrane protein A
MKKLTYLILILTILLIALLSSCDSKENSEGDINRFSDEEKKEQTDKLTSSRTRETITKLNHNTISMEQNKKKIGILIGSGGIDDNSFYEMQYRGLIEVKRTYPDRVNITYKEKGKTDDYLEKLKAMVEEGCDFIIGSGWEQLEPIDTVAKQNPDIKFVLVDEFANKRENVSSIIFAQNEGSFVVGALASMMSKTGKVGFIGGMDIPVIEDFRIGFKEGINYINPEIELLSRYVSDVEKGDYTGWENPQKAEQIALNLYRENNVNIIYAVAGLSGNGVIKAAKDTQNYVIGVDSDQDYMAKGYVLTSMMKRLDKAVIDICSKFINGEFEGGKDYYYGYENGGVSITDMKYTRDIIPDDVIDRIRDIEKKISSGKIDVTRYFTREKSNN